MRFDILRLHSGTPVRDVRPRLEQIEHGDPVILIRRQGLGVVTWHRVGLRYLVHAIETADDSDALSQHLDLDAANEVPAKHLDEIGDERGLYGVVLLEGDALAFSEGEYESALTGPSRGGGTGPGGVVGGRTRGPAPQVPRYPLPPPSPSAPSDENEEEEGAESNAGPMAETFTAFPSIEAPTTVQPEEVFEVAVGLSAGPVGHTESTGLEATIDAEAEAITLQVLVTGPFALADGSANFGDIEVVVGSLEHEPLVVRFVPGEPPDTYDPQIGMWTARITAAFFHEGVFIGQGYRDVRVNQIASRHITRESDRLPVEVDTPELASDLDVDLIISIAAEEPGSAGRFRVRLFSRHLPAPIDAGRVFLGQDAAEFAARLIKEVDYTIANPVSDETLATIGRIIAEKLPDAVEATLVSVRDQIARNPADNGERIPDVLLLTDDWAIPWELMQVVLDETKPRFLGAQANVGRWPARKSHLLKADPLGIRSLGVMVGHYKDARGVQPLPRAEEEGRTLEETYQARLVNADPEALNQLLTGRFRDGFEFEALHFAGHGESDPTKGTYLMYSDGARMGVFAIGSAPIAESRASFLFVNACQVGTADVMLGEYAGLAGLAIGAGFRGFVAPLWSVSDDIAQEISLGLYQASVEGSTVSSYLREVRSQFRATDDKPAHTTYMAYVFFGHPGLLLGGPEPRSPQ